LHKSGADSVLTSLDPLSGATLADGRSLHRFCLEILRGSRSGQTAPHPLILSRRSPVAAPSYPLSPPRRRAARATMPSWNDGESSSNSLLSGFSEGHDFSPRPPVCASVRVRVFVCFRLGFLHWGFDLLIDSFSVRRFVECSSNFCFLCPVLDPSQHFRPRFHRL
jgi:hypothetical protein